LRGDALAAARRPCCSTTFTVKQSEEGRAIDAFREIRVTAALSWDEANIELMFWFIRDDAAALPAAVDWPKLLKSWLALLQPSGPFRRVDGVVIALADMTAQDYVDSDRLDLDHLSLARPPKA
jgi:hypothetical protein